MKIIKSRFKSTQIKAAIKVNDELLRFYWSMGKDIVEKQAESRWGTAFFETLSEDLRKMFPGTKGFSTTNLRYMKRYYDMFGEILPQVEAELSGSSNLPQVGAEIYTIPWGHIKVIVDKCKGNPKKALFFVDEVIKNNWFRAVLLNFLDTNLYERQGKAISNFELTLPEYTGELAQEITKDPYNFDFVAINRNYNERELKDALTEKVMKLLLELGKGFAFVGKEYPLPIEGTEEYIDLLFYHLVLQSADVLVVATPTYFMTMNGMLKNTIDRFLPKWQDLGGHDVYLIITGHDGKEGLSLVGEELTKIFNELGNHVKDIIWGERVWQKGEVTDTKAMDEAYQAGLSV